MNTIQTTNERLWQPKVASLIVPVIITCIVTFLFFASLSVLQIVGSGILLLIIALSLLVGEVKDLPDKDIAILWVASILYNMYLLTIVL